MSIIKKIALYGTLSVSLFTLTACNLTNKKADLSFEDAYGVFIESHQDSIDPEILLNQLKGGSWEGDSVLKIDSSNKKKSLDVTLSSKAQSNNDKLASAVNSNLKGEILIDGEKYQGDIDFNLIQYFTDSGHKQYIKVPKFDIDLGSGNVQQEFIDGMAKSLLGKWIEIDTAKDSSINMLTVQNPFEDIKKFIKNIVNVSKSLKTNVIFKNLGETTYEDTLAYKIKLDPEALKKVVSGIFSGVILENNIDLSGIDNIDIQGLMIVRDNDKVEVLINSIEGKKDTSLKITKEGLVIKIASENGTRGIINLEKKGTTKYNLNFDLDIAALEKVNIKGDIDMIAKFKKEKIESEIDGSITIKNKEFIETFGDESVKINFSMKGENNKIDKLEIKGPDSALLLSQLLGDTFGVPYMKENQLNQ